MAAHHVTTSVRIGKSTIEITPDTRLLDDFGNDWAWAYVIFRPIPDFPGYCAGSDQTLWSRRKPGRYGGLAAIWRRIYPVRGKSDGRFVVGLKRAGKDYKIKLQFIMLAAFTGPRPDGMEVCHWPDPDIDNNSPLNLCWGTHAENVAQSIHQGITLKGEKSKNAKLTADLVRHMKQLRENGKSYGFIGREVGVDRETARDAVIGRTWAHVVD